MTRKTMLRRIPAVSAAALLIALWLCVTAFAQTVYVDKAEKVFDFAGLFSETQKQKLAGETQGFIETTGLDIVVVTTNDSLGKTPAEYADDFYDYNGFGLDERNSGLLLYINLTDRDVYISTTGRAIEMFSDATIQSLLDSFIPDLSGGRYYDGASHFIKLAGQVVEKYEQYSAQSPSQYPQGEADGIPDNLITGERYSSTAAANPVAMALLGGAVTAGISVIIMVVLHKSTSRALPAQNYIRENGLRVTLSTDNYLRSHTSKVYIPPNDTHSGGGHSGGGSSTHTSSSGTSHGGGGGKF